MKVITTENYEAMSKTALHCLLGYMLNTQYRVNIAITAGSTPVRTYEMLAGEVKNKKYFEHVHYYNFDEIPHKKNGGEGITMSDLRRLYYTPAQIPNANIHTLNEHNYRQFDQEIAEAGGLDAVLLGIGSDGHFCGNLPGTTTFADNTVRVTADSTIKQKISPLFDDPNDIPDFYITMGPAAIMRIRHLILIAGGKQKAEIMKIILNGAVDQNYPASILTLHPHLTIIMDKDAASYS